MAIPLNKKAQAKTLIVLLVFVLIIGIGIAGTFYFTSLNNSSSIINTEANVSIISSEPQWQVTHASGKEGTLTLWTSNKSDKKTEMGWILPDGQDCKDWDDLQSYDKTKTKIKDDKNNDLKIKCKNKACDGQDCYYIKFKDDESVNIDDFIKLGENSIIAEYQNQSKLNYDLDWAEANITLLKNISGEYQLSVDDIFVEYDNTTYKFGANDTANEGVESYKYVLDTSQEILGNGYKYYLQDSELTNHGNYLMYDKHYFDFTDICSRQFECTEVYNEELGGNMTECNYTSSCEFNQTDSNTLEVTFNSDSDIDPQIYIGGIKIYITDAQHLDENITFIENVYNETKTQDDIYTDLIPENDYVRIFFPQNLTNKNTIIIIAESSGNSTVEIYGNNGTELLGVFENIVPGKAKYETSVSQLYDTFDLKVIGDAVRFDYIVDPATVYIPYGYNILNDSSNFGTFESMSATSSVGGFGAEQLADNTLIGYWASASGQTTNQNITINFTDSFYFDTIEVFANQFTTISPNNTKVWVSDDGITYTNITDYQSLFGAVPADGEYDTITVPLQKMRYIIIDIKDNWGHTSGIYSDEIRIYRNGYNIANSSDTSVTATHTSGGSANDTRNLNYNDYWYSTNDYNTNLTWNFGSAKQIDSFIAAGYKTSDYLFANYSLLVSDDGSSWTEIKNGTLGHTTSNNEIYINFTKQKTQYFRLWQKDNYAGFFFINELKIYETANKWICTSGTSDFTNTTCWSSGAVPTAGEKVLFDSDYDGSCNITNNTLPQDLESFEVENGYTGTIHFLPLFAVGNWTGSDTGTQVWNVTNNINVSGGTMKIYGDYPYNITVNGHGQEWRSVSGNITIGSGATLDGIGLGFAKEVGPGAGIPASFGGGGGHGGYGGIVTPSSYGFTYGSATEPTSLGSGGGDDSNEATDGTAGGSSIKLHSDDTITIDGTISMNGVDYPTQEPGAGAGGSVWIISETLTGLGTIDTDGGASYRGGGGGGRISLNYTTSSYTGVIRAEGGTEASSGVYPSHAGTLVIPNNKDLTVNYDVALPAGTWNFTNLYVTNNAVLEVQGDNSTTNGTGVTINTVNFTLDSGSKILGDGLGFVSGEGPGAGDSTGSRASGAGHGGVGGADGESSPGGSVYGSETEPTSLGSGGGNDAGESQYGGFGGGAVKINSTNITIVGDISVNGYNYYAEESGGGAGGSVWLKASNILTVTGDINSNGGTGHSTLGGAGAGGRISLTGSTISLSGNIDNDGNTIGAQDGSGGTVYINATTSITDSGTITTTGYDGGNITFNDTLITLSGNYNATGTNSDANITLDYTDCASDYSGATFSPTETDLSGCAGASPVINISVIYPYDLVSGFNATQNEFFNVTLNVTCVSGSCGTVNVSLDPEGWSYQEDANETSSDGSWSNVGYAYDGDWGTAASSGTGGYIFQNYTKPSGALNSSKWEILDDGLRRNLTMSDYQSCWDYDASKLIFRIGASGAGGPCLDKNTLISTPNGYKEIYKIKKGDKIYSFNNVLEEDTVIGISVHENNDGYYQIFTSDGNIVNATYNHKFYTNGDYKTADSLNIGDKLLNRNLKETEIIKINRIKSNDLVYDISVKKNSNFFANNILVHNYPAAADEWHCYNGSWVLMSKTTVGGLFGKIYEEAIWWEVTSSEVKSGLISTTPGTLPFYTNASTNPLTTSSLSSGQSETITFWVNATGSIDTTHLFYAYANTTSNLSIGSRTDDWNVTITEEVLADTCTCAGVDTNWEVNMEDHCNLTEPCNLGTGTLSWIGASGYFNCLAQLNLTNRNHPPSATTFYYSNGCEVIHL